MTERRTRTRLSMIDDDGHKSVLYPKEQSGPYQNRRTWIMSLLLVFYIAVPFIHINQKPMMLFNIPDRQFYLFGIAHTAQDAELLFFLMTGVAFVLVVATALFGRVWCGYVCPQTVFLDLIFRRIEKWIEGPASVRKRNDKLRHPPPDVRIRRYLKYIVFILMSFAIAFVMISYFIAPEKLLFKLIAVEFSASALFCLALTGIIFFDFVWFREQMCLIICPYGRLQSTLQDKDTIVIGYDESRGEPRGKLKDDARGACIDCGKCVQVCPTGIDIRNGLQMECIGCALCIDACNEIMTQVNQPLNLIRYDSQNRLQGQSGRRFLRPRVIIYAVLLLLGLTVMTITGLKRTDYEVAILRPQGKPFVVLRNEEEGHITVQNIANLHIVNKKEYSQIIQLEAVEKLGQAVIFSNQNVRVLPFSDATIPVIVQSRKDLAQDNYATIRISAGDDTDGHEIEIPLVGL